MERKAVITEVGVEEYGLPISNVISIEKVEGITPIPHLPSFVLGIAKVRNELIPVIDLNTILYQKKSELTEHVRLIVLQTETLNIGVVVQDAKEILDIPENAFNEVGLLAFTKTKYFSGVVNLEDRLITMIEPNVLVDSLEGIKEIKEYMKEKQSETV